MGFKLNWQGRSTIILAGVTLAIGFILITLAVREAEREKLAWERDLAKEQQRYATLFTEEFRSLFSEVEKEIADVCRELRQKHVTVPIIMLTAKGEEIDKVVGLEIGADDYMTKPFSIRELLARIKAHLRREKRKAITIPQVYSLGDVEIDFTHFKVKHKDKQLDLTSIEVEILKYFIAHQGEVITREVLLDKIWGYEKYPTTRTIDNHILKLRKKIEISVHGVMTIFYILLLLFDNL
jgi:DNA-binding NarL/FixJ family response regulator